MIVISFYDDIKIRDIAISNSDTLYSIASMIERSKLNYKVQLYGHYQTPDKFGWEKSLFKYWLNPEDRFGDSYEL